MQFSRNGEWYQVVRITGPHHNFLGLKFSLHPVASPIVELSSDTAVEPGMTKDEVLAQVLEAIDAVNLETGSDHKLAAIRYVAADTPSRNAYNLMTREILRRLP